MKIWNFSYKNSWSLMGEFQNDEDWIWSYFGASEIPLTVLGDEINSIGFYKAKEGYLVSVEIEELKEYIILSDLPSLLEFMKIASEIIRQVSITNQIICDIDD